MRCRAALLAAVLIACSPTPSAASPTPLATTTPFVPPSLTAAPTPAPSPSPSPVATEYKPRLVLSVPYAPAVNALGGTTGRVGGLSPDGVHTFAVDEQERIYIWDRARLRIAIFESGKLTRAIPAPYVEQNASALLVDGGRIYLQATDNAVNAAYEIDAASGKLLQIVPSGTVLYPRERWKDGFGNGYGFDARPPIQRYARFDRTGATVAYAVEPLSQKGVDLYPRRDGALYELATDWGGEGSAYVYALLPSLGTPAPPPAPSTRPAPIAFGRSVPDQLTATITGGGSVELDADLRNAFWWLASTGTVAINVTVPPQDARLQARWNDGTQMFISADGTHLSDGVQNYLTSTRVWGQLTAYAAASPSRIAALLSSGATVRIADLASTERALTSAESSALQASLDGAFSVSEGELPGDLELPFPIYELRIGDTVVQLRRDHYASVSRYGAFAHDGGVYDVVRRALPVPALSQNEPRSLFLANKVTIAEEGYPDRTQDISRWKATIVRALLGVGANLGSIDSADVHPLTLTFGFAGGRTETVLVSRDAYSYRGVTYARTGIISIVGLRGVP